MVLASSGWRPGMLVNILQCAGQPPATKNYLAQHVITAEIEKLWSRKGHDLLKMLLKPIKFHVNHGALS